MKVKYNIKFTKVYLNIGIKSSQMFPQIQVLKSRQRFPQIQELIFPTKRCKKALHFSMVDNSSINH